ncbi:class I SAM-dependent methyltransferase [Glycomyces tarimensis]
MAYASSPDHQASIDFGEEVDRFRRHAAAHVDEDRRTAERISRPEDAVMVDVGCGAAGVALALAEAHPVARVVAVDAEASVVDLARERSEQTGIAIETAVADVGEPERLAAVVGASADVVWAGHVLHHTADQQGAVDALARLLAPGGRLAIGEGGLSAQFLPWDVGVGRPGLEARLAEARSRRMEAEHLEHGAKPLPYGWNLALEHAGLSEVRTFHDVTTVPAPLEGAELRLALERLAAWVGWFEDFMDAEDQAAWEALLDADSPHWLGERRDLHHLEIQTTYMGAKRLSAAARRRSRQAGIQSSGSSVPVSTSSWKSRSSAARPCTSSRPSALAKSLRRSKPSLTPSFPSR